MKIEWLVTNVTPVVSPDKTKRDIFRVIFDVYLANSGHFCGQEASFRFRILLLSLIPLLRVIYCK